jgi:hypothetical protein
LGRYDLGQVLQSLAIGEAIVTVMNEKGAPSPVAWTRLRAPQGSMSPTPDAEIDASVAASPLAAKYTAVIDRDSAREMLGRKLDAAAAAAKVQDDALAQAKANAEAEKAANKAAADQARLQRQAQAEYDRQLRQARTPTRRTTSRAEPNLLGDILGSKTTQTILKGVVEGIFGTRRR